MKILVAFLMIIAGAAFGAYVGIWLCFIGGIVQIIEEIKSPEAVNALVIAFGIFKILAASIIGSLCAIIGVIPGVAVLKSC